MDARGTELQVSLDDVETLARLAGLQVSAERLPLVTAELGSVLRAARAMDTAVARSRQQGGVEFDPAWSSQRRRRRS
ncbi:MAG TPA: hypothetical protein VD789_09870 [Thermomicrobiales bacterium]|nr:hypothetical protein [Thermomicrobiales bacterium]